MKSKDDLHFLIYELGGECCDVLFDAGLEQFDEVVTRPELFNVFVDFLSMIKREDYQIALLKRGDFL